MSMQIEFDPEKDRINREKHGVSLEVAVAIFETPSVQWTSSSEGHGEIRRVAVGLIEGLEFTCIFTMRNLVPRIISVRRSRHEERKRFWEVRQRQDRPRDDDA